MLKADSNTAAMRPYAFSKVLTNCTEKIKFVQAASNLNMHFQRSEG